MKKNQSGSMVSNFLLVVLFLALIGVASYFVAKHVEQDKTSNLNANDTLVITRSNPLKQPGVSDFTIHVNNARTANTILSDIKKLDVPSSGIINCPLDDGVNYTLQFSNPAEIFEVNATGCENVTLKNSDTLYSALTNNNAGTVFWNAISKATRQPIDPDPEAANFH